MLAQGSTVWVTLAEFVLGERDAQQTVRGCAPGLAPVAAVPSRSPSTRGFPRCCTVPPGDVLPLPIPEFAAIQNRTLLERERCGVCGGRGVCWHGQCWLCSGCAECDDFCDDKMCWN